MFRFMGIGGYNVVGKNMNAVNFEEGAVVLDMGWDLPAILANFRTYEPAEVSSHQLLGLGAIPNVNFMKKWIENTKAVVFSHAHLDHIAAAPHLLQFFDCPILGTPLTIEILRRSLKEHRVIPNGELIPVKPNSSYEVSKDIKIEFIHATHSTPQTAMVYIQNGDNSVLYANDWKLDNNPIIGPKTNMDRLRQIGKSGIKLFVSDSVNIMERSKSFSEGVVEAMLDDVLLNVDNHKKAVFVTTFSSHLARIKTILSFADRMKRRPVILGRSIKNFVDAGEATGIFNFKDVETAASYRESKIILKKIKESRGDYLVLASGHQGEEGSTLSKITQGQSTFRFQQGDQVVFSSRTIPHPINMAQRAKLENALHEQGARIFRDVHVSGHGSREDHRDLLSVIKPENYVPCHTPIETRASAAALVQESGYELGKTVYLIQEGQQITIQ